MKKGICIIFLDKNKMVEFLKELETANIKWASGERPTEYTNWYKDTEYTNHISLLINSDIFYKKPYLTYSVDFESTKAQIKEGYSIFLYR